MVSTADHFQQTLFARAQGRKVAVLCLNQQTSEAGRLVEQLKMI
jgi:hypothetical protein